MERGWDRQDQEAVMVARRRGARPDLATTLACGPLDEWVALPEELGLLAALAALAVPRQRAGVADELLWRTLATLPFRQEASLRGAAGALCREPAMLRHLGWAPAQIRAGDNQRHRQPAGRPPAALPCHPDTLRDARRRIEARSWAQLHCLGVQAVSARHLVRGQGHAIPDRRLVALLCGSGERPVSVAWRRLTGSASEQGHEAAVTRARVEQALALGGPGSLRRLLAAGWAAAGPPLGRWWPGGRTATASPRWCAGPRSAGWTSTCSSWLAWRAWPGRSTAPGARSRGTRTGARWRSPARAS